MSLSAPIGVGLLVGGLAAFAVYASAAPLADEAVAAPTSAPTQAPVPRPTVTLMAPGCESPAVLVDGECVVTSPGPTSTVPGPGWETRATDEAWGHDAWDDDGHDDDDRYDDSDDDDVDDDHHADDHDDDD